MLKNRNERRKIIIVASQIGVRSEGEASAKMYDLLARLAEMKGQSGIAAEYTLNAAEERYEELVCRRVLVNPREDNVQ